MQHERPQSVRLFYKTMNERMKMIQFSHIKHVVRIEDVELYVMCVQC